MELVCARHLIKYGYAVDVERLNEILICDLYATKGEGEAIVEIETGFIPPEHAGSPIPLFSAGSKVKGIGNANCSFLQQLR